MAGSPIFFGEGNSPRVQDTRWRILQKILGATIDGGAGGVLGNPYQIMALGGADPPSDGSVTKFLVYDSTSVPEGYRWQNIGTLAVPIWRPGA